MKPSSSHTEYKHAGVAYEFYFSGLKHITFERVRSTSGLSWLHLNFDEYDEKDVDVLIYRDGEYAGRCLQMCDGRYMFSAYRSDGLVEADPEVVSLYHDAVDWLRAQKPLIEEMREGLPPLPPRECSGHEGCMYCD